MRKFITPKMESGEIDISEIEFDLHSRDEIPKTLIGLQHIYSEPEIREEVFDIIKGIIPEGTDMNNGRPGMCLWNIPVLGTLRLNCNWNYDKVKEIADNHGKLREMLGILPDDDRTFPRQTIMDNLSLFTPEKTELFPPMTPTPARSKKERVIRNASSERLCRCLSTGRVS